MKKGIKFMSICFLASWLNTHLHWNMSMLAITFMFDDHKSYAVSGQSALTPLYCLRSLSMHNCPLCSSFVQLLFLLLQFVPKTVICPAISQLSVYLAIKFYIRKLFLVIKCYSLKLCYSFTLYFLCRNLSDNCSIIWTVIFIFPHHFL